METPPVAQLVAKSLVWLAALSLFITAPIVILRKKGCTAEINVIWYAFSLIFVIWWSINFALYWQIVNLPWVPPQPATNSISSFSSSMSPIDRERAEQKAREEELARREEDARLKKNPQAWGRYLYQKAREYLTDAHAELGLVASILIITIVPQLLNYILAGLSGCAATPRLVWQFEKIATWSLIKFLAAFGGISVAEALGIYAINSDSGRELEEYMDDLLWGMGAVGLGFVVAVFQVYTLEAAHALGDAWPRKPESWPYMVHRFFTRNLPLAENKPGEEVEPAPFDAGRI